MSNHKNLWFNQTGDTVYLTEHSNTDNRFPGWERNLGAGTWQGDYGGSSSDDFPNDDASYIEVPEGFRATVMQNSYEVGNQTSADKEQVFNGPFKGKLSSVGMNDMVSEIIVEDNRPSDEGPELTPEEIEEMSKLNQPPKGPNWIVMGLVGVALLGGLYFLTRKKKPTTGGTAPTPPATPPVS